MLTIYRKCYVGEKADQKFIKALKDMEGTVSRYLRSYVVMNELSLEEKLESANKVKCGECFRQFNKNVIKCKHHCHITGNYLSTVCLDCNLKLKNVRFVPLFFHNLSGFDSNIILSSLGIDCPTNALSFNSENVFTFSVGSFKFLDSALFLKAPLATLVENLKKRGEHHFRLLKDDKICKTGGDYDDRKFRLLTKKLTFPFKALTCVDDLASENFTEKNFFFNELNDSPVLDIEYQRTMQIIKVFNIKKLYQLVELYVQLDVLLQADCYQAFCDMIRPHFFNLAPELYITLPQLAFDSLKKRLFVEEKGEKIKLIDSENKQFHKDCRKGIRGGLVFVKKKVCFSSEFEKKLMPHMNEDEQKMFDELLNEKKVKAKKKSDKVSNDGNFSFCVHDECINRISKNSKTLLCDVHAGSYIIAFDFNNLYGSCMSLRVPSGDFRTINEEEIELLNSAYQRITIKGKYTGESLDDDAETGYILVCNLTFPKKVHKLLDKFCLGSRKMDVSWEMLSQFQKDLWNKLNPNTRYDKQKRNVYAPSFCRIEEEVIHYTLLKSYAALGIEVEVIGGYSFTQTAILKSHIDFCTLMRSQCGNKFEENLFKFISNLIFGKCTENVNKRISVNFFSTFEDFSTECKAKVLKDFKIINEGLVQANFQKPRVLLNRPIQIGLSILDYSRKKMLDFWYQQIIPTFGALNARILYSDTDSFYIQFLGHSEEDVFSKLEKYIDFSNFGVDHPRYDTSHKFELGYLKVDTGPKKIEAFLAVRKKSYCYYTSSKTTKEYQRVIKLKGVKKSAIENSITHSHYKDCLLYGVSHSTSFNRITKSNHKLYMSKQNKLALNPFDVGAKTKSCGICNTTYHSGRMMAKCNDINCSIAKLFLSVWGRISENPEIVL